MNMKRAMMFILVGLLVFMVVTAVVLADNPDYTATKVTNVDTKAVSETLVRQKTAQEVYQEHIRALNACDWEALMAQYPDQTEIHLPNGSVVKGREAVGELFAGFVKPQKDDGLCGIIFSEESSFEVGSTLNVQWVAKGPFLAKPYRGSDAYITDDGLMVAMVTTFNGADLMLKGVYTAVSLTNADTGAGSSELVRQKTAAEVYEEHIRALNACEWEGLMAQYPDQAEIHLPGGTVVSGRPAIGELFAGFVKTPDQGGLCGITFSEESRVEVAGVLAVQWVANAVFLAEPYRGSDAYVTDDGLMAAMVTTFNGADLKFKK